MTNLTWLYNLQKFGMNLGLERITTLLGGLDNPHLSYQSIHIAGTNGKGTVSHLLGNILQEAGYRTGVYTSPHLQNFSERITVNSVPISAQDSHHYSEIIKSVMKHYNIQATFFEAVTAMAFKYFCDKKVQYAVLETGLGGRLDATNVVDPVVSIITNITLDHMDNLGETIIEISREKAGIIKKTGVITAAKKQALTEIKKITRQKNVPLIVVGEDIQWRRPKKQHFLIQGKNKYDITTKLLGLHQGENIALAVAASEQINIPPDAIIKGIHKTQVPGRMEILSTNPIILLDGAHNPAAMQQLKLNLTQDFRFNNLIFVLGILKDKDIPSMIEQIAHIGDYFIVTESSNPRACKTQELTDIVKSVIKRESVVIPEKIMEKALQKAREIATEKDMICITGSLFTVGEARTILSGIFK